MKQIPIFIADDHAIMREGLRRLISDEEGMLVVDEACDGAELLEKIELTRASLVLMDLSMPGPGALEILRQIRRRRPDLRVLVLTMHKEASIAARMLHAGAAGFICKDNAYSMIGMALRKIAVGGRFIDPDLVDGVLAAGTIDGAKNALSDLSSREYEILQMLAGGVSLKAIADRLCISPKTVSTHKARLMEKLGVESTAALMQVAFRNGLASSTHRDGEGDAPQPDG